MRLGAPGSVQFAYGLGRGAVRAVPVFGSGGFSGKGALLYFGTVFNRVIAVPMAEIGTRKGPRGTQAFVRGTPIPRKIARRKSPMVPQTMASKPWLEIPDEAEVDRQPVDPVVGDPVRQDSDKIRILGSFVPSLCVL